MIQIPSNVEMQWLWKGNLKQKKMVASMITRNINIRDEKCEKQKGLKRINNEEIGNEKKKLKTEKINTGIKRKFKTTNKSEKKARIKP